ERDAAEKAERARAVTLAEHVPQRVGQKRCDENDREDLSQSDSPGARPAAITTSAEGSGIPSCSAKMVRKMIEYPFRARYSSGALMARRPWAPRLRSLPCPLFRLPSAPERSIEVHHRHELVAASLRKADLGGKQLLLGLEHLEIGREARGIPYTRQAHGFLVRGHGARALPLGLDELRPIREGS